MSQQGGGNVSEVVSAVVGVVNDSITMWADLITGEIQKNAHDPCYRRIVIRDYLQGVGANARGMAEATALGASQALTRAVQSSRARPHRVSAPGVLNHEAFGDFLIENGVLPSSFGAFMLAGPGGAGAYRELVLDAVPTPGRFVRGAPSAERDGLHIGDDVWIYARGGGHLARGKLQGPSIRDAYFSYWRELITQLTPADRPLAREELAQLVGFGDPTDIWQPGEPVADESILGNWYELEATWWELYQRTELECEAWAARQAELQDVAVTSAIGFEEERGRLLWGVLVAATALGLSLTVGRR